MAQPRLLFIGNSFFDRFAPFIRELGIESVLLATEGSDGLSEADVVYQTHPHLDAAQVIRIALEERVSGVVTKVLASHEETLMRDAIVKEHLERSHGIPVFSQSVRAAAMTIDKGHTRQFLMAAGIKMPPGRVAQREEEVLAAARTLQFPLVLKVPSGSFSRGVAMVRLEQDLLLAYRQLGSQRVIVEEFIQGQEVSVEVLIQEKRIAVMPAAYLGDSSADLNPHGRLRICPFFAPEVQERIDNLMTTIALALGAEGILQADLIYTGQELYLLELNARFGGTSDLTSLTTGQSLFRQAIEMVLGNWRPAERMLPRRICLEVPVELDERVTGVGTPPLYYVRNTGGCKGIATVASASPQRLLQFTTESLNLCSSQMTRLVDERIRRASQLLVTDEGGYLE